MANHSHADLPWALDERLAQLFAKTAMAAAFNEYYALRADADIGDIEFIAQGDDRGGTYAWLESPKRVEISHRCHSLDRVAQFLEFEALAACFGCSTAWGDGHYAIGRPGVLHVLPFRSPGDGLPFPGEPSASEPLWLILAPQREIAQKLLDPTIFRPPRIHPFSNVYAMAQTDPEAYQKAKEADSIDWGSRMDWAAAFESGYPGGGGISAKIAGSALMPSAVLGAPMPPSALARATSHGLERALSLALAWANPTSAQEIHARLAAISEDLPASMAQVKKYFEAFFARQARCSNEERSNSASPASAQALFEAFEISACSPLASPRKKSKNASL